MSEEKKDGCCGTGSSGSCCGTKKLLMAVIVGILIFVAGMMFAKSCPMGKADNKMCAMPGEMMAK